MLVAALTISTGWSTWLREEGDESEGSPAHMPFSDDNVWKALAVYSLPRCGALQYDGSQCREFLIPHCGEKTRSVEIINSISLDH